MENNQKPPGKEFLNVVGILMILYGVSSLGVLVVGLVGLLNGMVDKHTALFAMGLVGVLQFVTGIVGVINCGRLERATACLVWGIIAISSSVVGIILGYMLDGNWSNFVDNRNLYALLIVLPTLYLIGAVKNRNAAIRATK